MRVDIIAVGKLKERFFRDAAAEYLKRLQKYAKVSIIEVKDEPLPNSPSQSEIARVLEAEGERIKRCLKENSYLVVLDITGEEMSSGDIARRIEGLFLQGKSRLAFIIGGVVGLHPSVISRAQWCLSFSRLTFPYQLMRIILLEQLYRCFTIIKGEPYHR